MDSTFFSTVIYVGPDTVHTWIAFRGEGFDMDEAICETISYLEGELEAAGAHVRVERERSGVERDSTDADDRLVERILMGAAAVVRPTLGLEV